MKIEDVTDAWFATFGSDHLTEFNVNPMKVMLVLGNGNTSCMDLRDTLQLPPFNNRYCTTYPIEEAEHMNQFWDMEIYTLEELLSLKV